MSRFEREPVAFSAPDYRGTSRLPQYPFNTPESRQMAQRALSELNQANMRSGAESLAARFLILNRCFPQVLTDAAKFIQATGEIPWQVIISSEDGDEIVQIYHRYGSKWNRERPGNDELPPYTALFYEAAEVAREFLDAKKQEDYSREALQSYATSLPLPLREALRLTESNILEIQGIIRFAQRFQQKEE